MHSVTVGSRPFRKKGVPSDLVKDCIGHSSLRTTSRYTHFRDSYRREVAMEVGLFKPMLDPNGPNSEEGKAA